MPHRISSFRHACKHKGQIIKDSCNPPKGRSSKNYSGHFFTPWVTILLVHELQKTITRIVIWSLPCLSVKHIMRFQESGQQAWLVKKIFELKHPALLIGEPHSLYGEGGGGGEGWVMKINFVLYFFRCCQALEAIYFLHDPKWFPPMPPPSYFVPQAGHLDLSLSSTVGICTNGIAPLWSICNIFSKQQ